VSCSCTLDVNYLLIVPKELLKNIVKPVMSYLTENIFLMFWSWWSWPSPHQPQYWTWLVPYNVTPMYQRMFKSVKLFMSYRQKTFFLFGRGALDLDPNSPIIKLDLYRMMLHLCTKHCSNQLSRFWLIIRKPPNPMNGRRTDQEAQSYISLKT